MNVHGVVAHYVVVAAAAVHYHWPTVVGPSFPCDILQNVPCASFDVSKLEFLKHALHDQGTISGHVSTFCAVNVHFLFFYRRNTVYLPKNDSKSTNFNTVELSHLLRTYR